MGVPSREELDGPETLCCMCGSRMHSLSVHGSGGDLHCTDLAGCLRRIRQAAVAEKNKATPCIKDKVIAVLEGWSYNMC